MRVRGSRKIDRIGLIRLARKFNIAPVHTELLKREEVVDLPEAKAAALVSRGYAIKVSDKTELDTVKLDDRNIDTIPTVEMVETDENRVPFVDETEDETEDNDEANDDSEKPASDGEDTEVTL